MKRHLIFIRHAMAKSAATTNGDINRELTTPGQEQARCCADELSKRWPNLEPVRLYVSEALRTQQTAVPLSEKFGVVAVVSPWLYEASLADWQKWFSELKDGDRAVMVVGHNPGISQFATQLLSSARPGAPARRYDFSVAGTLWLTAELIAWKEAHSVAWQVEYQAEVVCY